jgi:small subunit ribosomal protein S18
MPSASTKPRRERRSTAAGFTADRRRSCRFCTDKVEEIDFTNIAALGRMISDKGRIRSRRFTGACRRHQNQIGVAVKRAREMALLPYVTS